MEHAPHGSDRGADGGGPRLALIFPPAMHPTSPPLGVASIAAYLRRGESGRRGEFASANSPEVRVFDLNLAYHEQALRWLRDGRLKMSIRKWDHAGTAAKVAESCDFLRGRAGLDAFLDLGAYNHHAGVYRNFTAVLNGLFENFARRLLCGLQSPALVDAFFNELVSPVRDFQPDIAGISLLFSQQLYFALAVASMLKADGAATLLGGATLSVMPRPESLLTDPIDIPLGDASRQLELDRFIDFLMLGEGEAGIDAFVHEARAGREGCRAGADPGSEGLRGVPGLVYKEGDRVVSNPGVAVPDLNVIPLPDFSDFDLHAYHSPEPILPYLSSRGCFWRRCTFCTHRKTYLAYREEPVQRTASNLAALADRYGVTRFNLVDEMIHPNRFGALSRELENPRNPRGGGPPLRYSAYAKPVAGFDRGLLDAIFRSGGRVIMWGVESGNQRVLDAMGKGARVADMEAVLRDAHGAGVRNLVFLMFGFPSETREDWGDTLSFLERNAACVDALSKSRFLLLRGSEIYRRPEDFHISRIAPRPGKDPISVAFDYEADSGLTPAEARKLFEEQLPLLEQYGKSPHFGMFRDHLLIHASTP